MTILVLLKQVHTSMHFDFVSTPANREGKFTQIAIAELYRDMRGVVLIQVQCHPHLLKNRIVENISLFRGC